MKPRVLFVDHTALMGGGEIALLNLVIELKAGPYVPIVLLFSEGPFAERLRAEGIETHVLLLSRDIAGASKDSLGLGSLARVGAALRVLLFTMHVARFIRWCRVRIVHTNSLKADVIGGLAARIAGVPLIWHVRDRIADDYLPPTVVRVFRLLSRMIPNYLIANSESTMQSVRASQRDETAVIPSGVSLNSRRLVVHDGTRPAEMLGERDHGAAPTVGLVGRISPWKGQDVFLRAVALVHARFPGVRFQIIGAALFNEQAYEAEVRALCGQLGLNDIVEFTGFRSDVPALIERLDLLVHASTTGEPFGQVVIEGMAAGKAVIATNGGGIPEIVEDGVTGLLVPMGNATAMAEAIGALLSDPERADRLGRLGRERVLGQFTIGQTAARVTSIYDGILRRKADRKAKVAGFVVQGHSS